tara:strand:+ start:1092 stop:2198 length:1107 start_codon:yes stop_codon:yes gene_type:complete
MANNTRAVITNVSNAATTAIVDISRVVALISDVSTVTAVYSLYTDAKSIETAGYATTSDFYKMGVLYFNNGGGYLYGIPLADTAGNAAITAKLATLENISDITFSFGGVLMDSTIGAADEVGNDTLATYALNKPYHIMIDSADATIPTAGTTDIFSLIGAFYAGLTGDNALVVPNISGFYTGTDSTDKFLSCSAMGIMVGKVIGSQTLKFKKPLGNNTCQGSDSTGELTDVELTFILGKNVNVYTGVNERAGKAFIKEGTTLKNSSYVDTSFGAIWIKENIDENIYNLLLENSKVSINATGYAQIESKVTPIFELGIKQKIINPDADVPFTISFAGNIATRTIAVTYTYVKDVAGHFVTNTITITQEA